MRASSKPQGVRERLFRAALKAFAEHGFAEVSVDEIVKAARTTKPMLYYYFKNKAGLYQTIGEEVFARLQAGYDAAANPASAPIDRLRAFVLADFRTMRESPDLARFIYRTAYSAPRDAPAIDYWKLFMPSFTLVTSIVEAAQSSGLIGPGPAPLLALPLFGLTSIWSQVHLGGPMGGMLDDAQAEAVVQFYLNGVGK